MKLAGSNRNQGKNLSAESYSQLSGASLHSDTDMQGINRALIAVRKTEDHFNDWDSAFFAPRHGSASYVTDERLKALDESIEAHGLKNVLSALQMLLEQRVEDGAHDSNGNLLLHLSRHNAYARMAERIATLTYDKELAAL